jgi:hypothetical protein
VTTRIDENQHKMIPQRRDVAGLDPILDALRKPVLEDKWRAFALDPVMDADPLIVGVWHVLPPSSFAAAIANFEKGRRGDDQPRPDRDNMLCGVGRKPATQTGRLTRRTSIMVVAIGAPDGFRASPVPGY